MKSKASVQIRAIKTSVFHQGQDLFAFLDAHLSRTLLEGNILAITSKIISLAENRVRAHDIPKVDLVKREAEHYLGEGGHGAHLTIKHGILIPSAGIDESNSETGDYILFPENPYASAEKISKHLKTKFRLRQLGVVLTDSHTTPLRRGVTGISLAHWGIRGTEALVGQPDLFERKLKFTHVNVVDSLAAMAVFLMGEADDSTPLAVIEGAKVEFTDSTSKEEITIEPEADLYFPLLGPHLRARL
jgi:dihydrofolate synthase / folylpolyglutamate synthase